ncbi:MAG: hypothetical protein P4L90_13905 [Rhodopila sp.]|nr:hypothetical protein [Rhodopila sp.]
MTTFWRPMLLAGALMTAFLSGACTQSTADAGNPNVPGATGKTIVPGSTSTVAGDADATYMQQKWQLGPNR